MKENNLTFQLGFLIAQSIKENGLESTLDYLKISLMNSVQDKKYYDMISDLTMEEIIKLSNELGSVAQTIIDKHKKGS